MRRRCIHVPAALALGALLVAAPARALEYAPIFNASVLGGQYFFQNTRGNVNGNVSVTAAAVIKASQRWSWLPMYVGNYQGTKGVSDAVPAGSLYQQEADQRASLTGLYSVAGTSWKLKPSASYKYEFLKQTRDESWGHGLFDFEKIATGFEAEKTYREPFSYRFGLDIYRIRFPQYRSLESQSPLDPLGNPLNRTGFNRNVLDTYNFQLTASGSRPFPYDDPVVSLQGTYSLLYQHYIDQSLVDVRGQIESAGRRDFLQTLNGAVGYPRSFRLFDRDWRLDSRLGLSFAYNGSNQNYYDANTAQFFSDAYSYTSYSAGPGFALAWGDVKRPTTVSTSFVYTRLNYVGRQAQDGSGVYTGRKLGQDLYVTGLSGSYPISPGFFLKAQANFLWARSNNTYEKTYAYNYRSANYLMGFTYEY